MKLRKFGTLAMLIGLAFIVSAGSAQAQAQRGSLRDQTRSDSLGAPSPPPASPGAPERPGPRDETRGGTLGTSPAGQARGEEAPARPEEQKVVRPQNTGRSKPQGRENCYTWRRRSDGQMITHCDPVKERPHNEPSPRESGGRPEVEPPREGGQVRGTEPLPREGGSRQGVETPRGGGQPRGGQPSPRGR